MQFHPMIKLFLFTTEVEFAKQAEAAGVDSVIVDWECIDKHRRQKDYSTEVNTDTPEDVARLAEHLKIPITVRINRWGHYTATEISTALDNGAQIIMLPMAQTPQEVEQFVDLIDGRAQTLIQIETQSLVDQCRGLKDIGWDYAYIGLNDLMISRGSQVIWDPLIDGTVETIYGTLPGRQIGCCGVTIVGGGYPLPFLDLFREMARLGCGLSFLRRTFKREIVGRDFCCEVDAIRATWNALCQRSPQAIQEDRDQFLVRVNELVRPLAMSMSK